MMRDYLTACCDSSVLPYTSRERGALLLSVVLFSLLLSIAGFSIAFMRIEMQAVYVDVTVNAVTNRNHLIYAEWQRLKRTPTATELEYGQYSSGIVWSFDVVGSDDNTLRYRLPLAQPRWHQRLRERLQGDVINGQWYQKLSVPADIARAPAAN